MTQDEAFLQDIAQQPDDESIRLIYADWLDEQGQCERAEFIRIQCEREGLLLDNPRRRDLFEREEVLLEAHRDQWLTPLRDILDPPQSLVSRLFWTIFKRSNDLSWHLKYNVEFRRGFVEGLMLSASEFLTHAADLFGAVPTLRAFTLCLESDEDIEPLFACPFLRHISDLSLFYDFVRLDAAVKCLETCPHLWKLRELSLTSHLLDASCIASLATMPLTSQLTALRLYTRRNLGQPGWSEGTLGDEPVRVLSESAAFKNLRVLELCFDAVSDLGVCALALSQHLSGLEVLNLAGNQVSDAGALLLAEASYWSRMRVLDLSDNPISEAGKACLKGRFGDRVRFES
jgi:uncharacterized protein (TIGR02996 family)